MAEIKVKDKEIVVPGQVLATGMEFIPSHWTYRLGDDVRAHGVGIVRAEGKVIKLTPLSGRYMPKVHDVIIAQVTDVLMSGWRVDTNSAYSAVLPLKDASSRYIEKGADLTRYFALGDYIMCKITNVTSQRLVDITMKGPGLRKIEGGRIIEVNTNKVPRIIGKQGSMVTLIKSATGCRIAVGQNGLVWVDGEPEMEILAVETIKKIEKESHISGLTDTIKAYLDGELKKMGRTRPEPPKESPRDEGSEGSNEGYYRQREQ